MSAGRKALTRRAILAYYPLWNDEDRRIVGEVLNRAKYLYVHDVPSGGHLTARDSDDRLVFWLGAGYVQVASPQVAVAPAGVPLEDGYFVALSRRCEVLPGHRHQDKDVVLCPRCAIHPLAASGVCMGGCDE